MKAFAIIFLVLLASFTIYQGYSLVKKIIEKKKCKGNQNLNSTSTENDIENKTKEESE